MNIIKILIVASVLVLGIFLRLYNYDIYPQRGATSDEYTYSFLGVSLFTKGVPISWSHFDYPNKKLISIDGIIFPIVSPYFDHPPLYGLLVGGWSILFGDDTFEEVDLKVIRIVPIILSAFSSFFVFLIGNKLYGFKTGIWALLIYSTTAFFIMNSRVVVAENLLTMLLLISTYILISAKKITFRQLILLGILSGFGLLTKVLGVIIYLANATFILLEKHKARNLVIISIIFSVFAIGFIAYGFYYDKEIFLAVQGSQSGRNIGPRTLWTYTLQAFIVNKIYLNGWYFFGLFSLFSLFSDVKKHKAIIIPSFLYFFLLLLSLSQEGHSGWYMIPLYPFMSLSIAYVVSESIKRINWIILIFVIYIGITNLQYLYEAIFGLTPFVYRLSVLLFLAPFVYFYIFKKEFMFKFLGNFWFYVFIIGNIILTRMYEHPV